MSVRPFAYQAILPDGSLKHGVVIAADSDAAADDLARRGLMVLRVRSRRFGTRSGQSARDVAALLRLLSELLDAGFSLGRALRSLDSMCPHALRPLLPSLRESVRQGQPLSLAIVGAGIRLSPGVVGLIEAGEAGGAHARGLRAACELIEFGEATRRSILAALAYPALLVLASSGAIAVLVLVALPRFTSLLVDMGRPLPALTSGLMRAADLARAGFVPGTLVLAFLAACALWWSNSDRGRHQLHRVLIMMPVIGPIRFALASARMGRTLGSLLERGVAMHVALGHAAHAAGDASIRARVLGSKTIVLGGSALSVALASTKAVTTSMIQFIAAGEETGRLPALLTHAAELESEAARRLLRDAVRLIEPALILAVGGLIAVILSAMLQAVYSIRPGV